MNTVSPAPLPGGGATGDGGVSPPVTTEPWTEPIGMISVTETVNEHVPLCGLASPFVAVSPTVYVPGATVEATDTVAEAVPPRAPAGAWLVIAIPAAAGVTVALKPVTVPSGSVAVTVRVAGSPRRG